MMNFISVLSAVAILSCPVPADNFYSWYAPETATAVMECAVNGEYYQHLDFNGDGELSVLDAVGIIKRYSYNVETEKPYTFCEGDVMDVVMENCNPAEYCDYFYYEIDFVNGAPCRKYDLTVNTVTEVHVYCELNDRTFQFTASIDPARELVSVID